MILGNTGKILYTTLHYTTTSYYSDCTLHLHNINPIHSLSHSFPHSLFNLSSSSSSSSQATSIPSRLHSFYFAIFSARQYPTLSPFRVHQQHHPVPFTLHTLEHGRSGPAVNSFPSPLLCDRETTRRTILSPPLHTFFPSLSSPISSS